MASKKLNLETLADRVVIEPMEKEEKTASGIILPETPRRNRRKAPSWPPVRAAPMTMANAS